MVEYEREVEIPTIEKDAIERHIEGNYEHLIREHFPDNAELMIKIANAESNMIKEAFNPEWHKGCQGSYGLFQIACVNYSGNPIDLYDPLLNIQLARQIYERQGLFAWGVCHDSKVECGI